MPLFDIGESVKLKKHNGDELDVTVTGCHATDVYDSANATHTRKHRYLVQDAAEEHFDTSKGTWVNETNLTKGDGEQ